MEKIEASTQQTLSTSSLSKDRTCGESSCSSLLPLSSQMISQNDDDNHIGDEAIVRLRNARIAALEIELQAMQKSEKEMKDALEKMKKETKVAREEKKKMQKTISDQKNCTRKLEEQVKKLKNDEDEWRLKCQSLRRALDCAETLVKKAEMEHETREARLSKAIQECQKFKATLVKATAETREGHIESKKEIDNLQLNVKKLEKQRTELIAAFKTQMQLVDVLKRQKIHADASRMLMFREEEFMKIVNWENESKSASSK